MKTRTYTLTVNGEYCHCSSSIREIRRLAAAMAERSYGNVCTITSNWTGQVLDVYAAFPSRS